ncbi:MAG: M50 family metallopeptidase [Planctomycetota bacterium]
MFQVFPLFRLFGIRFYADMSILMLVFFVRDAWSFLGLLATIILHELGHALAARGCGAYVEGIVLQGFGGVTQWTGYLSPGRHVLVSFAGPAVNLAVGLAILVLGAPHPLLHELMQWGLVLGIFNLIPILPLDGGHILEHLLSFRWDARSSRIGALQVTRVGCILLFAATLMWFSHSAFLLVLCALFFFSAHRELGDLGIQGISFPSRGGGQSRRRPPEPTKEDEREVREKVDRLLAKISEKGMTALSDAERAFLKDASQRYR